MAYINGKKVLFSAKVNIEDVEAVEVINSGYDVSQAINDDDTCDLVITDTGSTTSMVTVKEKEITENGTYNAREDGVVGYSSVKVNIKEPKFTTKTITQNGIYNASEENVDGYSTIIVNTDIPVYNLSIGAYDSVSSLGGYIVNQSQQCLAGQQIILYAEPNTEYKFDGWYYGLGGELISTSSVYSYTMPNGNTSILAKMSKKSSTIM